MILTDCKKEQTIKFPRVIDFETSSSFFQSKPYFDIEEPTIRFDLSETYAVHSAFIGYLIDLKRKLVKNNQDLHLMISPELERLFQSLDLETFFNFSVCY